MTRIKHMVVLGLVALSISACRTFVIEPGTDGDSWKSQPDISIIFDQISMPLERIAKAIALLETQSFPDQEQYLHEVIQKSEAELRSTKPSNHSPGSDDQQARRNLALLARFFPDTVQSAPLTRDGDAEEEVEEAWRALVNRIMANDDPPALLAYQFKRLIREHRSLIERIEQLPSEEKEVLVGLARVLNDFELLEILGMDVQENQPGSLTANRRTTAVLRAAVTVWVDQGMRIESGMGIPDQVLGSGFFVDPQGYIVTNYHVIASQVDPAYKGVSRLFIKPFSESSNSQYRVPARVVGYDEVLDLALLKAELDPPGVVSLDFSTRFEPGESMFAAGSPGGLENTLTLGIVSALGRRFLQIGEVTQIDMPINPGNSGGPIFEPSGRVAGVVFAGIEQFEGVNFAIPAQWIFPIFGDLFTQGQVMYPWAGVAAQGKGNELVITYIHPTGPGADVPLRPGDRITSINGRSITSLPDLQYEIITSDIGDIVVLGIQSKNGEYLQIPVFLEQRPAMPFAKVLSTKRFLQSWFPPLFGMEVQNLGGWNPKFSITEVFPDGLAESAGLSEYDTFELNNWIYMEEDEVAAIQIKVNRREKAYMDELLQLATYISINSFF